jgi:hypothetical protein
MSSTKSGYFGAVLRALRVFGVFGSSRAQVALEYIYTYGWILLAVMAVGGVLVYHNVSNTRMIVPDECVFLSGIGCTDMVADGTLFSITVLNEFGFAIRNITFSIYGTCNSTADTSDGNMYGNPNLLLENKQARFNFECQNLTNMRVSELMVINYVSVLSGEEHIKTGKLEYSPFEG